MLRIKKREWVAALPWSDWTVKSRAYGPVELFQDSRFTHLGRDDVMDVMTFELSKTWQTGKSLKCKTEVHGVASQ